MLRGEYISKQMFCLFDKERAAEAAPFNEGLEDTKESNRGQGLESKTTVAAAAQEQDDPQAAVITASVAKTAVAASVAIAAAG